MGDKCTVEEFWTKLEGKGEKAVRIDLAKQAYGADTAEKYKLVQEWLRLKEQERKDNISSFTMRTARWAAIAAIVTALCSATNVYFQWSAHKQIIQPAQTDTPTLTLPRQGGGKD